MPDRVALCTLLDADRAWLTGHVARQWARLDFGDAEVRVFACVQDADPATVAALAEAVPWPVACIGVPDIAERVDDLPRRWQMFAAGPYPHPAFLHKIAVYREAVRVTALAEYDGWQADNFFWLDSDTVPDLLTYRYLRADLDATTGVMAPAVYAGLYPERRTGHAIPQYRSAGEPRYVQLVPNRLQHADFAGFGCTLVPRRIMAHEQLGWEEFGAYRYERRRQMECGEAPANSAIIGEDVWWFRRCEQVFGPALCLDTRCLCRHYHRDGSYWEHYPDGQALPTRYVTTEVDPAQQVTLRGIGARTVGMDLYRDYIPMLAPGKTIRTSPEYASELARLMPNDAEIVAEEEAEVVPLRAAGGEG